MITGSQEYIRDMNRKLVLDTIIHNNPLSRANLSKKLHLTKATISAIVQELIDLELVEEIGSADTTKGRKPILLRFNQSCGNVISMDIALDKTSVMISDLKGENCIVKEYPRQENVITEEYLSSIIQKTLYSIPESTYGVIGICMGIHGVVNHNEVQFTPYYTLEHKNIAEILTKRFHIPVFVENEANLCVLGESAYHYSQKNLMYINVHSGIGMGIMMDGILFRGKDGFAGEIGHTILFPEGRPCPCGNHGCLEQYASEKAILEEYAREKNYSFVTIEKFIRDYYDGDSLAISLIDHFILYMSIGLNNILNTLNPDIIILNSSFSTNIPGICERIQAQIHNFLGRDFSLITGEYQDISEFLGGVHICVNDFLNSHSQIF